MTERLIINPGSSRSKVGSDPDVRRTDNAIEQENLQQGLQQVRQKRAGGADNAAVTGDASAAAAKAGNTAKTGTAGPDETVWGNDKAFMSRIDEVQRADLRLFVRIRHLQKVTCSMAYEDISKEPYELDRPLELMIVDMSVGGIGVICEHEIDVGRILGVPIILDTIPYNVKCEVVYCIPLDGKFRAGLKIAHKDKLFMRHLKIFVARISLTSTYASGE